MANSSTVESKRRTPRPATTASMLALSIRQPWAELVMLGIKAVEFRSRLTHVRGRILIYASLTKGWRGEEEAAAIGRTYDIDLESLPRGFLIGSVEIIGCTPGDGEFEWHLKNPERLATPVKLTRRPNPVWSHQPALK